MSDAEMPPSRPNRMMLRRALFLMIVGGIVAFIVLAIRLFRLQILDHEALESAALAQQMRSTVVSATRGTIYDRNGSVLAMSATSYTVYISPAEIAAGNEDAGALASGLASILGADEEKILAMTADRKSWYKTVARKIDEDTADKVRAFRQSEGFSGIHIEPDTKRYYPYSTLASHLIGFVGTDNTGLAGVEYTMNDILSGTDGSILRLKNSLGTDMLFAGYEEYVDAVDGSGVYLTLDTNVQYFLEKHLSQAVRDYDIQNGAAGIVMDPKTGAILAMASLGNFDLNHFQLVSDDVQSLIDECGDQEEAAELLAAEQQKQWRNKALSDTYEPGSTFKILTLAMALEEGVVTPASSFYCGGSTNVQGRGKPLKCWKTAGHGAQTLTEAVQHSCNVAFTNIGLRLGEETFYRYCADFGFFEPSDNADAPLTGKTGIALPGESGSIWWSHNVFCNSENLSQLAAASFGQTFNITPLQLITAVSACCNGGYLMKPYVVERTVDASGAETRTEPTVIRQVISEETSRQVNTILEQVVCDTTKGTGKNAYVAGYRVAGKTGTSEKVAQQAATGEKEYIVSFIGYAPADEPQVVCLILLDTPSNESGIYISGGQMAAPVVGKVLADVLPALGVHASYTENEEKYLDRAVPSLTGLSLEEAAKRLKETGFACRVIGDGVSVTDQLPLAGTVVAAGTTVILYADAFVSPERESVPDVTGYLYDEARDELNRYGLFLRSDSTILADSATVRVAFQSVPAGESVPHGTVIEATLVNADDTTYGRY